MPLTEAKQRPGWTGGYGAFSIFLNPMILRSTVFAVKTTLLAETLSVLGGICYFSDPKKQVCYKVV